MVPVNSATAYQESVTRMTDGEWGVSRGFTNLATIGTACLRIQEVLAEGQALVWKTNEKCVTQDP